MPEIGNPSVGTFGPPRTDFSSLGDLFGGFMQGKQAAVQSGAIDAVKNTPPLPDGTPDFETMTNKLFQAGDIAGATQLAQIAYQRSLAKYAMSPSPGTEALTGPPASGSPSATPAPPAWTPPATPVPAAPMPARPAGQLGDRFAGVQDAISSGQFDPQGRNATNFQPPALPAAPASPEPPASPAQPSGGRPQLVLGRWTVDRANQIANQLTAEAMRMGVVPQFKEAAQARLDAAKQIRDAIAKTTEPTGPMKEAASMNTDVVGLEGAKNLETTAQKANAEEIGLVVKNGGVQALHRMNILNQMEDAFKSGGANIATGPGAEAWMKAKQFYANATGNTLDGLPQTEAINKLNSFLAAEVAKSMTSRPSQLEFQTFVASNPGLLNSPQGSIALISFLKQTTQQDIALGRLARNRNNWNNWSDVQDKFFADPKNQIVSPFTGKPLGSDRAAPVPPPTGSAQAGPPMFRTPQEAIAAKLPSGTLIRTPSGLMRSP